MTATAADFRQSPSGIELEQSDEYSRYLLYSKAEILAVLRTVIQKGALITVHFDHRQSFLLTSMIALDAERQGFVLDLGSDDEMNRKALLAQSLILTTIVDKVKVQFRVDTLSATQHEGRPAFFARFPDALLRLQRREYFRLATPVATPVKMISTLRRTDGSALSLEAPLLDISGGGIGLMVTPDVANLLSQQETLPESRIALPDEGLLIATLHVRNMFDVTTRNGLNYMRVGCEFVDLPSPRLAMVQRYITRVERERKARLSGLA